jgi:hypothetical protein
MMAMSRIKALNAGKTQREIAAERKAMKAQKSKNKSHSSSRKPKKKS